jgi:protein SCO1/2
MRSLAAARGAARAAVIAAAASVALCACSQGSPHFNNMDISGVPYAAGFTLTDQDGKRRSLADFRGKVVSVFFGYTQCPDVCPTTLAEMKAVRDKLGTDAGRLQVVFITVDPERDTPALLKNYVAAFDPTFIGLTGTPEEIATVAKDFKVFYEKVPGSVPGQYTMNHTAGSYVFDPAGHIRLFVRHGQGTDVLASDIRTLLEEKRG